MPVPGLLGWSWHCLRLLDPWIPDATNSGYDYFCEEMGVSKNSVISGLLTLGMPLIVRKALPLQRTGWVWATKKAYLELM